MAHDLDKETARDETMEQMRLNLLTEGCPPKLADEMVRDLRMALSINDAFSSLFDGRLGKLTPKRPQ